MANKTDTIETLREENKMLREENDKLKANNALHRAEEARQKAWRETTSKDLATLEDRFRTTLQMVKRVADINAELKQQVLRQQLQLRRQRQNA